MFDPLPATKGKMKQSIVKKIHFSLLLLLLVNFTLGLIFDIKFSAKLIFAVKVITYISAIVLFFLSLKQSKLIIAYCSLYILSPFAVLLSWLVDGILGALVGSLFFAFLAPPERLSQYNNYELRSPFSGFMGSCCQYDIYQNKWLVLERKVAEYKGEQSLESLTEFTISKDERQAFIVFEEENEKQQSPIVINLR